MVLPTAYGGDGTGTGFVIPESASALIPFANIAARDTWASANLIDLLANQTIVSVTGTPDTWYIWRGASNPATYAAANWEVFTTVVQGNPGPTGPEGPDGPAGTAATRTMFSSISERNTFYGVQANRDNLNTDDIITVYLGDNVVGDFRWAGTNAPTSYNENNFILTGQRVASSSIEFARNLRIFDHGQIPAFQDMGNDILALAIGQRFTVAGGSQNARQLNFPAESTIITANAGVPSVNSALQAIHTYTIDTTGLITNQAIILQGTINFVVAPNFYIIEIFRGVDDTGPLVFRERFDPGGATGIFIARADGIEGRPSPQRFLPNTTYFFRLTGDIAFQFVQADGVTSPAGTSTGFEFTFQDLATQDWVNQNASITVQDEGIDLATKATTINFEGAGVTATGTGASKTVNIPGGVSGITIQDEGVGLTDLTTTINFTGAGVTASGTGASKTVNIPGGGGGGAQGVNVQDEGVALTSIGETLNFTGAGVTATGGASTKTIEIPGGISGITIQDEGVELTAIATSLNFEGAGVTATGTSGLKTVNIPGGISGLTIQDEGTPLAAVATTLNFAGTGVTVTGIGAEKTVTIPGITGPVPSLHNLSISIASRVDLNTNLNVAQTITFDVTNFSLLTSVILIVTTGTNITLTNPVSDGVQSQSVTLSGTDTSSIGTVTFQLSGNYSGGTVVSNIVTIQIQNLSSSEQAYYGTRSTNDFATVDVNTLSAVDVTNSGTSYGISQPVLNGEILGILSPNNRDPISIVDTVTSQESLPDFTEQTAVRIINSVSYNLRFITNNSGFNGTFNYRVTTE